MSPPIYLFAQMWAIMLAVELAIMAALPLLLPVQFVRAGMLIDASLLTLISAPLFWHIMIRPLRVLAATEQVTSAAVVAAADAIIITNDRGLIESFNPAAERLFGYAADEVVGRTVTVLVPSPHKEAHDNFIANYARTEASNVIFMHREVVGQRKDGTAVPIDLSVSAVAVGDRRFFTAIARDNSERKRTEAALQESEQRFRGAFDSAAIGMALVVPDGRWLQANRSLCEIVGYSEQELLATTFQAITHPDDLETDLGYMRQTLAGEIRSYQMEKRYFHKRGHVVWILLSVSLVRNPAGQPLYFVSQIQDITERKRAEAALRESEQRYRQIFENSNDAIFVLDRQGRFTAANQRCADLVGMPREEILGQTTALFLPGGSAQSLERIELVIQKGQLGPYELEVVTPTGKKVLSLNAFAYFAGDTPVGAMNIARDITRRKQLEEDLRHAKEAAEAATRAKSEFLANMSHEIRTPMNGIVGATDLALGTPLSTEQHEYLDMVKSSADSLLMLLNDILDLSKIEAGKLAFDRIDFSLRGCLDETKKALLMRACQKGLTLAVSVHPDVPDALVGDPGRLRQVVVNLVGNAIKFTEHGKVAVEVGIADRMSPIADRPHHAVPVEAAAGSVPRTDGEARGGPYAISDDPPAVLLHFAVRDTGIGIAQEKQGVIFLAFEQGDGSTARKHGGTGLGLAISAELVQMMGGRMWVESEIGRGSTFHFSACLGVQPAAGRAADSTLRVPPSEIRDRSRPLHILLAEDNVVNQRVVVRLLEKHGHTVVVAGNGREALAAFATEHFDVMLMDVQMPEMDGYKATAEIRKRESLLSSALRTRHIPIIALTANAMKGDEARCLAAGMDGYVSKPVQREALFAAIERLAPPVAAAAA